MRNVPIGICMHERTTGRRADGAAARVCAAKPAGGLFGPLALAGPLRGLALNPRLVRCAI